MTRKDGGLVVPVETEETMDGDTTRPELFELLALNKLMAVERSAVPIVGITAKPFIWTGVESASPLKTPSE